MNYARRTDDKAYHPTRVGHDYRDRGRERQNERERSLKRQISVQDYFLGRCKSRGIPLEITLKNEQKEEGRVIAYDNWTLFLETAQGSILLFKSGILCLKPLQPLTPDKLAMYPNPKNPEMAEATVPYLYRNPLNQKIA